MAAVVGVLARCGRREAAAEKARLAEQARVQALRALESIWAKRPSEFEEYIANLCRRDGCGEVLRVGAANDLGVDVIGQLPDGRKLVSSTAPPAANTAQMSRSSFASCKFTKQARAFADRHGLGVLITSVVDTDLVLNMAKTSGVVGAV
ncbi:restriction endonuclease [Streptomyces sp. NRRL F-2664]|uniref:restriction endonuclease n=1 Tax=Streptomyces sp. NRRL F-2664 TaxID=1463842 RepID=UPI00068B0A04|nr:restriction endonuclease [Streptomyces sp. NRRL F-2664]